MDNIKPGKYTDLSNEAYHAHTDSISRSAIMALLKSPRNYWANYLNPLRPDKEPTPAMRFGEAFHTLILEPHLFEENWCVKPELLEVPKITGLLKDLGRAEYDRQKEEIATIKATNEDVINNWKDCNQGKQVITDSEWSNLHLMKAALQENEQAWNLLTDGVNESSYFWEDADTGVLLKARPDVFHDTCVVDLKTAKDASASGFQRAMCNGGYHIQAAMILDGIKEVENKELTTFINVVIEKEYPYNIGIYIIDPVAIEYGREQYKKALHDLKDAREKNEFKDFDCQIIGLPAWYQ